MDGVRSKVAFARREKVKDFVVDGKRALLDDGAKVVMHLTSVIAIKGREHVEKSFILESSSSSSMTD
ncbi:hypothetical protein VNO78_31036 [Psophocarpus tetragonolobus]|uniref:Uncharacterized protein n=1 Tax=Psophocarpus tetragonolobus TaxID=3891 RepID=A0AAN9X6T9_PSOTE